MAYELFNDLFEFDQVLSITDLSKKEIIATLQNLRKEAEEFEKNVSQR